MALIVRIDVDRPYGRAPKARHILSRVSSDFYFPKVAALGYLKELRTILRILSEHGRQCYAFFRRCTLPSPEIMELMSQGGHKFGLHLENSRSFETLREEKALLESHLGQAINSFSKHGSGGARFGWHHYAPYEAERYVEWGPRAGMKLFLGNLEDPTLTPVQTGNFTEYPSAFWLEPSWRDTKRFPVEWLLDHGKSQDIVMLIHPENVLADSGLTRDFCRVVEKLDTKVLA
jgi:hypothetical protein